jgi:CubicO group peptidase (beta-lactamase class C family)
LFATASWLFQYSNAGYILLGLVIEQIAGMAYPRRCKRASSNRLG